MQAVTKVTSMPLPAQKGEKSSSLVRRPRRVQGKKALPVRKALLVGKVRLDPLVGWVPRALNHLP
jgi:hypothetical protein